MLFILNKNFMTHSSRRCVSMPRGFMPKSFALMSSCVFNDGMAKLRNPPNPSKASPLPLHGSRDNGTQYVYVCDYSYFEAHVNSLAWIWTPTVVSSSL